MPTHIRQIDYNNCRALVNAVRRILLSTDKGAEAKRQENLAFSAAAKAFLPGGESENFGTDG
jgi:hypothetical protein